MSTPRKGLRNLRTMTNKSGAVQTPHEAFICMAALHREKQRHLQELGIVTNRLGELTLRLEQINSEQVQLAGLFDMPIQTSRPMQQLESVVTSTAGSQGFKFKY